MPARAPEEALKALVRHCRAGDPLDGQDRDFLAGAIELHLTEAVPLDRALGLKQHGGVSVARRRALDERDRLLRRLWRTSPEWRDLEPLVAARLMSLSAERYASTRFPRERDNFAAPASEPAATWWRILRTEGRVPKAKRLQQILSREIQDGV